MTHAEGKIDIHLLGIAKLLSNQLLAVPLYQRAYAWEEKHVSDLLSDLHDAWDKGSRDYFLGSVVCMRAPGQAHTIVDGQQRLATTATLIAAIRDYLQASEGEERANILNETYLFSKSRKTLERTPKPRLNVSDRQFFEQRILFCNDSILPDRESHRKLNRARELCSEYVARLIADSPRPVDRLNDFLDFLEESAKIIFVDVPDDSNAFLIFETLNDRGLDLAITDLLKNYLFGLGGDRLAEIQQNWADMAGSLESAGDEPLTVDFVRHYWSSRNGATRAKDLYLSVKASVRTSLQALEFSDFLRKNASLYAALLQPDHSRWADAPEDVRESIDAVNRLGMVQVRPLLLAVAEFFSPEELQKALSFLVSCGVRFLIVGGLGGGTLEAAYAEQARHVCGRKTTRARQLRDGLRPVVPTDEQFQSAFETATVSKPNLARYYLHRVESYLRRSRQLELDPSLSVDRVNLEHILARGVRARARELDDDTRLLLNRLGNMTLLGRALNTRAANREFAHKKEIYAKSEILITKELLAADAWDLEEINKRQRWLAEIAVKTWPLTFEG